jgi:drug/metabolite transporter (DMT)-like permease
LIGLNSQVEGCLAVAGAALIWGINGVIVSVVPLNPYAIAFFRVLIASLFLLIPILLTQREEVRVAAKAWKQWITLGLLLSIGWGFLFQSMKLIPIANAVLLNFMAPIFVALLAPIFLKESLTKITIFALTISMGGMMIITSQQNIQIGEMNLLGVLFGLLAGLAYASFIILSKKVVSNRASHIVAFYAYLATMIFLWPSVVFVNLTINTSSWLLLLLLGIVNTAFAVTLYLYGLKLIEAQKAVIFTYLEPLSSVIFGSLFLAQAPSLSTLLGGGLILFAVYLVASR